MYVFTMCTKGSLVINELDFGMPFFLATWDLFSVLEMHLRYSTSHIKKKTLGLCFNLANPGVTADVVKD